MVSTFQDAITYLNSFIPKHTDVRFAGQFGLDRQRYLLKLLGNPQDAFPCVHITGTSGKSSTSYILSTLMQEAGYTVGLHISPHLVTPCERIQVNNKQLTEDEFVSVLNELIPHIEDMRESFFGKPSYFEILVAMTFLTFQKRNVDIAVVEVGLGGRFDGTNVVTRTLVSIITNVGLDHTQVLGDTVEKIIDDKKEIIKPNTSVVSGATQERVKAIIRTKCLTENATISFLNDDATLSHIVELSTGTQFDFSYKTLHMNDLSVGLLGSHQANNAALAIMAAYELNKKGFPIVEDSIRHALKQTQFNGRLEVVRKKPLVVLDGAHNEDKMNAVVHAFSSCFTYTSCTVVLALKTDKDSQHILPYICALGHTIIVTRFTKETDVGTSLSKDPKELATFIAAIDPKKEVVIQPDPILAVTHALQSQTPDSALLITGSLYLVGEIKKAMLEGRISL